MSGLFWRLQPNQGRTPHESPEPVIYCPEHALYATNVAFVASGIEPAETMEEAAAVVMVVLALQGAEDTDTFITSVEGAYQCERCDELAHHATLTHDNEVSPDEWKERYMK